MHVSKVWKFDSKTIYKLQEIHRLQKYKIWSSRISTIKREPVGRYVFFNFCFYPCNAGIIKTLPPLSYMYQFVNSRAAHDKAPGCDVLTQSNLPLYLPASDQLARLCSAALGRVTRVNSTNVLDEGLRIGEVGRRMNSKISQTRCVSKVNVVMNLGCFQSVPDRPLLAPIYRWPGLKEREGSDTYYNSGIWYELIFRLGLQLGLT
jgi:hypothetical protein